MCLPHLSDLFYKSKSSVTFNVSRMGRWQQPSSAEMFSLGWSHLCNFNCPVKSRSNSVPEQLAMHFVTNTVSLGAQTITLKLLGFCEANYFRMETFHFCAIIVLLLFWIWQTTILQLAILRKINPCATCQACREETGRF